MCFSATASFTASAFLAIVGIIALAKTKKPSQILFTAIPLLFAAQQCIEGLLWLSFSSDTLAPLQTIFTYGFLFFAFIVWPIWLPLSLFIQEPNPSRKKILSFLLTLGTLTSLSLLFWLFYAGTTSSIVSCHILYQTHSPIILYYLITLLYIIATVGAFFSSSVQFTKVFGCALGISYLISYYWYYQVLVSVWCFFAALLSVLLVAII